MQQNYVNIKIPYPNPLIINDKCFISFSAMSAVQFLMK
jgi:hypothetical protein